MTRDERLRLLEEISRLKDELGFREQALHGFKKLYEATRNPGYLNQMGLIAGQMKDHARAEKFLREAAREAPWAAPLFNLALNFKERRMPEAADAALNEAIEREADPAYYVLRAILAEAMDNSRRRDRALKDAMERFEPVTTLSDWSMLWLERATRMLNDTARLAEIERERKRRRVPGVEEVPEGQLPERRI